MVNFGKMGKITQRMNKNIFGGVKFWHLLIVFLLVLVYNPLKRFFADLFSFMSPFGSDTELGDKVLTGLETSSATISDSNAAAIASDMLSAMDRFGTDEEKLLDAFKRLKTQGDLNKVRIAFGSPRYFEGTHSWIMGSPLILDQWIKEELTLNDKWYTAIAAIYHSFGEQF